MRKMFLGSAMVVLIILTAGFASAFETTENDGFIYLYAPGQTTAAEATLYDTSTAAASSFQVTLVDALANQLTGTKYTGQELFSGTITLPVGAGTPADGVAFNISAIIDRSVNTHWAYKGTDAATGTIQVSGDLYFLGKEKDYTVTPNIKKNAYGVYGFVGGNSNFNGAFRGVFYVE
ncbi:MAG: hypothetical protein WAN11_13195 [Syntrophobacteraceae bacterium]